MSSFTRPLTVTKIITVTDGKFLWFKRKKRKQHWVVDRGFKYFIGEEDSLDVVAVPKGFKTDFASVPRVFWYLLPPDGVYTQAAVLHDYLCENPVNRSQAEVDLIFLEAMEVLGVAPWRRKTMYQAVRAFQWAKDRKNYSKKSD